MKKLGFIAALILFLASCGFHLRGLDGNSQILPYPTWRIENAGAMKTPLHDELSLYNAKLDSEDDEAAVLRVLDIKTNKETYRLSRIGTVSEYLLTLSVKAQVLYHGQVQGKPIVVRIEKNFPYSNSNIFGKKAEEDLLWDDMYKDAAQQIVRMASRTNFSDNAGN